MRENILFFFLFIQFKNRKKKGTVHSKRDAKKSDFLSRDRGGGGAGRAIALPLLLLGFIS